MPVEIAKESQCEGNQGGERQHPDEDKVDADKFPDDVSLTRIGAVIRNSKFEACAPRPAVAW